MAQFLVLASEFFRSKQINKNSKKTKGEGLMEQVWQSHDGACISDAVLVHEGLLYSTFEYGWKLS